MAEFPAGNGQAIYRGGTEMNFRRAALGACLTLATVAFAAPSMASASWLHDHDPITQNEIIQFGGQVGVEIGAAGGTTCGVGGAIEATTGSTTGHLVELNWSNHLECETSGVFAGCEVEGTTVTNSSSKTHIDEDPVPVHIETTETSVDLVVTNITLHVFYTHPDPDCRILVAPRHVTVPVVGKVVHFGNLTLKPDNSSTISTLKASGTGEVTLYNSTAAQAANTPFATQGITVNEVSTALGLTEPETWGIS
jgi:hypothetical protein